jgi:hypothetical protein
MFDSSSDNEDGMINHNWIPMDNQANDSDSDSDDIDYFKIEKGVYGSKMIKFSELIVKPISIGSHHSSNFCKALLSLACEKESIWIDTLKVLSTMPKGICAGPINRNELSFKCYDCGNENEFHIFCSTCFYDGDHRDHRVQ